MPHATWTPRRLLPALALALAPALASAQVWTALATEKIRPSATPAGRDVAAHVSAARNEFEAFQIGVTGAATNVRATAGALTGPATIPVRLYREALIDLANASALDGGTGRWPDALVPDVDEVVGEKRNAFPFDVPPGESRALWAEVLVPPDAPAGDYHGTVQVTWDGGAASVPVTLTVWPFSLPSTPSLKSIFLFTYGAIPLEHGLSGDAFSLLRQRYGAFALDHRISLANHDDGAWADLSHFDTWFAPLMDGAAQTRLAGARNTSLEYLGGLTDTTWMTSWASHGETRGWLDRQFQYTCDEPPATCAWTDIPVRAAVAHQANPGLRTLVTTTIQDADANGVTSSIDLLVPVVNYLDDRPGNTYSGNQRARYDAFLAGSARRELWAYQSCMSHGCGGSATDPYFTGWPTYVIDASAVRNRAMEWLSFRYRLSGELYYETAMAYGHDPWTNQWDFSGNGDGTLFYPGKPSVIGGATDIPIASIRLKMIREGMEDYEYLKRLSELGDEALARQVADALFPNAYSTDQSPVALMAARETIARRIIALSGGAVPPATYPPAATPGVVTPPTALAVTGRSGCAAGGGAGAFALTGLLGALRLRRRRRA